MGPLELLTHKNLAKLDNEKTIICSQTRLVQSVLMITATSEGRGEAAPASCAYHLVEEGNEANRMVCLHLVLPLLALLSPRCRRLLAV